MSDSPYRGSLRRKLRIEKHNSRAEKEKEDMIADRSNIKIDSWNEGHKPNNWLWIRLHFEKPIIPNEFKSELVSALEVVFHEHF